MKYLLTISVPTFNRDKYLFECITSIKIALQELNREDLDLISVFISDNSENDLSENVVKSNIFKSINLVYNKNLTNIGSDQNIANCYSIPNSKYVMILGDDDFLTKNSLRNIIPILKAQNYDLIFLKSYGLTRQSSESRYEKEYKNLDFNNVKDILFHRNIHLAFISTTIFNKTSVKTSDINEGVGKFLVQLNFVFKLLSLNAKSLYIRNNYIASTRNNTGGYDPFVIFLSNYFNILLTYNNLGLTKKDIYNLKIKILNTFYIRSFAQYLRKINNPISETQLNLLDSNFNNYFFYKYIYRKCLLKYNKLNFLILSACYIIFNIFYYPNRFFDISYHLKNYLKYKSKPNI
jgi:abequosyltransferase